MSVPVNPDPANNPEPDEAYRRRPTATYRFQFSPAFTFSDAAALVPYLFELGISHCYASPIFKPRQGSTHGYDIVDYSQINPILGTEQDFDALISILHAHGMGLILDVVPNHMGIGSDNAWWMDVLENGPSSHFAAFFDIDWQSSIPELTNKVLLPILEDHYGRVLEDGKLQLRYDGEQFSLWYYEHRLPITIDAYDSILSECYVNLIDKLGNKTYEVEELRSILTGLSYLPRYTDSRSEKLQERHHEQKILKRRFASLHQQYPAVADALAATLTSLNGVVGNDESFDALDCILSQQPYRLAFWRVATDEINYRRFFDINDMVAVRVETPQVFDRTHDLLLRLLGEGKVNGLRVDHPDGLWNPEVYFIQLQEMYLNALEAAGHDVTDLRLIMTDLLNYVRQPDAKAAVWPLYVVAEKILTETEPLPRNWGVNGTTGYDFMALVNGLFVDADHRSAIDGIYVRFIGEAINFAELIYATKKKTMANSLASELQARGYQLARIVERNRRYRGFTMNGLTQALSELIACMDIYRTYITGPGVVSQRDENYVAKAVAEAKRRNPRAPESVFDFVRDTLLLQNIYEFEEEDRRDLIEFVMKFQQLTGPVMAKSVEDTAFYIYNRLVSLNEVGGEPVKFGVSVDEFHENNQQTMTYWPHTMLATSTHDTKRSEDVRARINILSEIPDEWREHLNRWAEINVSAKAEVDDMLAPDRNDEYLLYQTLLGSWPMDQPVDIPNEYVQRIVGYMLKATKEAKVHTSWINPYNDYDAATRQFIETILRNPAFVESLLPLQKRVAYFGHFNSLAQVLLKVMSPGVPDIYQGNEMWDFSLVDPDNRRPVDYDIRKWAIGEMKSWQEADRKAMAERLLENVHDGYIKTYVTYCGLKYRKAEAELITQGDYIPLPASGAKGQHVVAFAYQRRTKQVITVVPRLVVGLCGGMVQPPVGELWLDTFLRIDGAETGQFYRNVFTGETHMTQEVDGGVGVPLSELLGIFPVALVEKINKPDSDTETR